MDIKLENVNFAYNEIQKLLDNFSITLEENKVFALSGASGCGKTTLLGIISQLIKPNSGVVSTYNPNEIAILFQEDRLLPNLNVEKQIQIVRENGYDASNVLKIVNLESERHSQIKSLSGGMKRRVSIARFIAYSENKKLLIMDEPFTGVDFETAKKIMDYIKSTHKSIIYTSHDKEILSLADEVIPLTGKPLRIFK